MNNEIKRKITSLTLMTIMLAGGMFAAVPSMVPAAHAANANLFVSAENSQFDNYMSGPQVIEVVVIDSDINDTDEAKGEPDVTVNGKILRMVQAVDGNWYGYFADRTMAQLADSTVTTVGTGLDFGTFCDNTSVSGTVTFTDTTGIAIPGTGGSEGTAAPTAACAITPVAGQMNVLRETKEETAPAGTVLRGQIGLGATGDWPIIQLYTLNPTGNVVVTYNKGGGAQSTTLTFDTVQQFAGASLDRAVYTTGAQVHATITDLWLNIDPTDEDSWTFGTVGTRSTNYQVFNENGAAVGDNTGNTDDNLLTANLSALMCDNNCILILNPDKTGKGNVVTLQDNDDTAIENLGDDQDPTLWETLGAAAAVSDGFLLGEVPITITEQGPNSGIFGTYDESDNSNIVITDGALRGTSASLDYNETPVTILVGFNFATIDIAAPDSEWNSGEEIPITIVDNDANKNSRADEDLDLNNPATTLIPSLRTGAPATLALGVTAATIGATAFTTIDDVDLFSDRALFVADAVDPAADDDLSITFGTMDDFFTAAPINSVDSAGDANFHGFAMLNYDVRSLVNTGNAEGVTSVDISINTVALENGVDQPLSGTIRLTDADIIGALDAEDPAAEIVVAFNLDGDGAAIEAGAVLPMVVDIFGYGFLNDGLEAGDRVGNQIIRLELEETGDNTGTFLGTLEYVMLNQLNILDPATYASITSISDEATFIAIEDLTDEDSPRVTYLDRGADGVPTQVSDQQAAPSHSGIVSLDKKSYKQADTVTVTVNDLDLNVDTDLIDIYTTVSTSGDFNFDRVGTEDFDNSGGFAITLSNGDQLGRLLDITFDDEPWVKSDEAILDADGAAVLDIADCTGATVEPLVPSGDDGLGSTGFTLIETSKDSGIFIGDFQVPANYCTRTGETPGEIVSVTGLDIEVNYVDFRDASGEVIEVGSGAGVRANTGSVSLDRTVYPVPFGIPADFTPEGDSDTAPKGRSVFPIHQTGMTDTVTDGLDAGEFIANGDLIIHVRVNDPDFDISAAGEDTLGQDTAQSVIDFAAGDITEPFGPVKISVIRGSSTAVIGYAGGATKDVGLIEVDVAGAALPINDPSDFRNFGPMTEIAPDAGIFEADIVLRYTDGPADATCPVTTTYTATDGSGTGDQTTRFNSDDVAANYCILQGDILQVEYTDPADASGDVNTVTDSATFDLRNGVLQSDKSVYIIGSDMILTLIEPDFDLDNDQAETYDLDLIEWDSDAATVTMGNAGGQGGAFDPEPFNFRETGDSTGIFQIVIEIPQVLGGDKLERGEEIVLEYSDWGPSGSDYVGDEDEDVNLTIFTSNFGATVELDQKVYTWTDKVYITIVAPDHNFDSNLVDEIGDSALDPIKISTRGADIDNYKLVETGTDTGIFTGEVILTGFTHDADGDTTTGDESGNDVVESTPSDDGSGPTNGLIPSDDDDGITVSFEFSEDETVVGSALIRWNIGEVQWLEASYPASGTGVVRVIDPDMNLKPEAVDNFVADVWSDSDAGGIDLTVTETNEATGIFEGTVFFTTTDESSGHRLRVAEGDTVTAEYEDNTLPNPYTTADELDISATSLIGTIVPPLERAPAANLRTVDAFGNSLSTVSVDQQVQITADLANGQDREQAFAYLVQIQDGNGVTVSLAWITGSLSAGQSFSPALSWIPTDAGEYTATAFVWESVDNPTALSPPVSTTITVQ